MTTLKGAGVDLSHAGNVVLDFLAAHPQYLTPAGAAPLHATLRQLGGWGLPAPAATEVVAACPALARTEAGEMEAVAAELRGAGLDPQQLRALLQGYPAVLRARHGAGAGPQQPAPHCAAAPPPRQLPPRASSPHPERHPCSTPHCTQPGCRAPGAPAAGGRGAAAL